MSFRIPSERRRAVGLAIVLVAQLMLVLDTTVVNVALPHIQEDLHFSPATLSWVLNAYTLAFGGLLLLGGRLGDVLGRRRVFTIGLAVFTGSSLAGAFATDATFLVVARALQGVGAALAAPSVLALLTTSAPDDRARNRALALFTAVSSAGASIGLIAGGLLTDLGSWRLTLLINVPIGLAVLAFTSRFLDETPRRTGRFDVVGAVTATAAAVSAVYALVTAPEHGWASATTIGLLIASAVLLAVFVATETRVAHPLLRLSLLKVPSRAASLTLIAMMVGSQFSMFFLLILFVERVLDFGPLAAGVAFLPLSLSIFASSRVSAALVGRFGPWPLLVVGTAGMMASFLWISGIDESTSYVTGLLGPMILNGLSAGIAFMPTTVITLSNVEPEHAGSASGLMQTMQQLGGAVGLAIIVSVYSSHAVPGQVVPGLAQGFATSAIMCGIAVLIAISGAVAFGARRRVVRVAAVTESESVNA
ncbi:MFS transporter [Gordonia sp. TBRC 11910]|uniref:MFS transporter n=1 Tax=Gordonia asplenii TaxID=2725283 RepID=A0A848L1D8_9ACTN|nr:MFS transporter [Gordonia asplenii]NMO04606.1 MFS transporter [Gordonia asplenii]